LAVLALLVATLWGCATSAPPPRPSARPFENVRRVAVVVSGESKFEVVEHSAEPGRTFNEILTWYPTTYRSWLQPLAELVHRGINFLFGPDSSGTTSKAVAGISPKAAVSMAFAQTLAASELFQEIQMLEREPVGEDRRRLDAIVRLTVPEWGLVRVQAGEPDLMSGYADVRAELVLRSSGLVVWKNAEDVTDPERLPLKSFKDDPEFTRHHVLDVLTRAGQRLANELVYARSAGR
jgi:hypothetical protein